MRLTVGCRGAVIERVNLAVLSLVDTFLENAVVIPEFLNLLFSLHEIQIW